MSSGRFDPAVLTDGDIAKTVSLPAAPANEKAWIQFEFAEPQTIRAITLATGTAAGIFDFMMPGGRVRQELESSDDGREFRPVIEIPGGGAGQRTVAFPPVTARFFRVAFTVPEAVRGSATENGDVTFVFPFPPAPTDHKISELILHTGARVHQFEEKAAFVAVPDLYDVPTPPTPSEFTVPESSVVDLTSKMRPDGSLSWTPPNGRWVVLRMGYSLTGAHNSPACRC